jgi:hypothetical protein
MSASPVATLPDSAAAANAPLPVAT